jgi:lysozyme
MKTSADGIAVIKHFEGLFLKAYPDPKTGGEPWTAMYGATGPDIRKGMVFTQEQADARLSADLASRESDATQAIRVPMSQGQYDAFVSILFNVGLGSPAHDGIVRLKSGYPSTLLRLLNETNYLGARSQFAAWVSPGSNVEHGLRKRRRAEQALWDGLSAVDAIALGETMP